MTEANKVTETVETARKEGLEIARKIWLAGVGAYGRVYQEAAGRVEKVTGAANEMFDQLVEKGEQVEDLVRSSISKNEAAGKVTEYVEKTTAQVKSASETRIHDLEERFEAVRKTVVETVSPFMDKVAPINIFAIGGQIEALTAKVEALTAEVEALKGAKAAPKAAKKTETEAA
ncbi:PHA_granule_1, poly(hydroxyalkanoate) granule-associated protein [Caulobacteraceae bacterium]|jgi:poly(hydroxyalkanoate) granule-associated protein|uniref:phasin family protein n=1 Tax=Aquidulcibacter sp. TaxID=2052990 RepID=UPI0037840692|eukprot:gene14481-17679_t